MAKKDFFTGFYKSNLDSVAAWIWLEAVLMTQNQILESGKPMTPMDAAREYQQFMKYDEEDMPLATIKQKYYRMSARNRERLKRGKCEIFEDTEDDIREMLCEIRSKLNEITS